MVWIIIVFSVLLADQVTKYLIVKNMAINDSITVINNFFYITHWKNKGAAWGIFQNGRIFFIVLTIIILAILVYILAKYENKFLRISLSLLLGGAIGNLIDRISRGSVVDFFQFYIGSYEFPIFNVADTFIVIGTIMLAIYMLFIHKDKQNNEKEKEKI
jgi:signal peptidase II